MTASLDFKILVTNKRYKTTMSIIKNNQVKHPHRVILSFEFSTGFELSNILH